MRLQRLICVLRGHAFGLLWWSDEDGIPQRRRRCRRCGQTQIRMFETRYGGIWENVDG